MSDPHERSDSLLFSDMLRAEARRGKVTVTADGNGNGNGDNNDFMAAMDAYTQAKQSNDVERIVEARAQVQSFLAEPAAPAAPVDFGAGARPPSPTPVGMNDLLRASARGWTMKGRGVR